MPDDRAAGGEGDTGARPAPVRRLRVFVSSPRDVGDERAAASRVVERLRFEFRGLIDLEPVFWEQLPMRATDTFQAQIPLAADVDLCVFILWSWFGTPLPETFRKPDGSSYSSGTEFEFENAVQAHLSRGTPDILVYRKTAEPRAVLSSREQIMQELAQRDAVTSFIDRYFRGEGGTFKAAFREFPSTAVFEEMLEQHLRELVRERLRSIEGGPVSGTLWAGSPFRGLAAFDVGDTLIFCGRTDAVTEVVELLRTRAAGAGSHAGPLALVVGGSGSGKSSLARAGVMATLTQPRVIQGVAAWRRAVMRPMPSADRADTPLLALAAALLSPDAVPELAGAGLDRDKLAELLGSTPDAVIPSLRLALPQGAAAGPTDTVPHATALALLVDQFEELFSPVITADQRDRFACALAALVRSRMVWVVGTLRSDFFSRLAELPEAFSELARNAVYELHAPRIAEIAQMIRRPAQMAGLAFERRPEAEEGLDDRLRDDAAAAGPGALPLLQFTLDELYERRQGRLLRFAAYEALGGLSGALRVRAEEEYARLPPATQAALPLVLSVLTRVELAGGDAQTASRPAGRTALASIPGAAALVDAFVAARLLVAGRDEAGQPVLRVAHEALLREWPRARDWVDANRAALGARARLISEETVWRHNAEAPALLLAGPALTEALALRDGRTVVLEPGTLGFVERSARAARRAKRFAVLRTGLAAAMVLLAAGGSGLWWYGWTRPFVLTYSTEFVNRDGMWEPLRPPLSPAEASQRSEELVVTRRGRFGPVESVVIQNGSGACPRSHNITTVLGEQVGTILPCRFDLRTSSSGLATREEAHDAMGNLLWAFVYTGAEGGSETASFTTPDGYAFSTGPTGLSSVRLERFKDGPHHGMFNTARFFSAYGQPVTNKMGAYGFVVAFDDQDRLTWQGYLGPDGRPMKIGGTAGIFSTYHTGQDAKAGAVSVVEGEYRDAQDGRPVIPPAEGFARVTRTLDAHGRLIRLELFDTVGQAMNGMGRWSKQELGYDSRGNQVEMRFYDRTGQPAAVGGVAAGQTGWAALLWTPDGNGRPMTEHYLDPAGRRMAFNGAMGVRITYDPLGLQASITTLDEADRPAPGADRVVTKRFAYDAHGRLATITYFDAAGQPMTALGGTYGQAQELDGAGRQTLLILLGRDGRPTAGPQGWSRFRVEYDERGNALVRAFFDANDAPMLVGGYHKVAETFSNAGRRMSRTYLGVTGELAADSGGVARITYVYDARGNEVERAQFDPDGHPVPATGACMRLPKQYDDGDREISQTCVNAEGKPVMGPAGYARQTVSYDAQGRLRTTAYFDADDQPVNGPDRFASVRYGYDDAGHKVEMEFRNAAGGPAFGRCVRVRTSWESGHEGPWACAD